MTPVKVLTRKDSYDTLRSTDEWDVFPTRYSIVRFLELPAALILPFSLIFIPFI